MTSQDIEFKKKAEENKKELIAIANFISNKGLKLKTAQFQEGTFDYFRGKRLCLITCVLGDVFHKIVLDNGTEIMKMFKHSQEVKQIEKIEDSIMLGNLFKDFQLLFVLDRDPRREDEAKKKYPKYLMPSKNQVITEKGFYSWNVPKPKGKLALFLMIGVLIAIAFMCFNLWPLWLKIGIWYLSFYTLIVLVGFILLRLFMWLFLFHFGVDFWIFPNFFIDSTNIMDSFRPVHSFERRNDDLLMYGLRLLSAVSLIFLLF
jgi:translocation protein SEC62